MSQYELLKAAEGRIAFGSDVRSVGAYVMFLLEVITWVSLMLGN